MAKIDSWELMRRYWAVGSGAVRMGVTGYQIAKASQPLPTPPPIDPMEGMARGSELEKYKYDPDGFYLGRIHPDHGLNFEASIPAKDDRHIFIIAGSASGKGVTFGIQNALRWKGGLLAIDPKGEMAEIAGMRRATRAAALKTGTSVRQFVGQKVAILDPMGETRGAAKKFCVSYDPMGDINMKQESSFRRIAKLAAGMVIPEEGSNAFFSDTAETILAGTIEAVKTLEQPHNHTLPFVRLKILGNVKLKNDDAKIKADEKELTKKEKEEAKAGFEVLYEYLKQDELPDDGHAAEAASVIGEVLGSDEAGSYRTTLSRNLKWLADPQMKRHLKHTGFSLWQAVQEGWSVFLVLKPDDIDDFKNWLRMNVQLSLSAKMAIGTNQKGLQTLFFLDEFPILGRFKEIEKTAGYIRGYGVKLVPIIQNIGQIQDLYSKNWETFMDNAAALIGWGFNGLATEQYFSDRLGKVLVEETTQSTNHGVSGLSGSLGNSQSTGMRERQVRFSNDVHAQGERETMRAFVIPASGKAFTIERVPYMALKKHKIYDSPEHILKWEKDRRGNK